MQAFVLAVSLTFEDEAAREAWLASWLPLAEWVRANEAATLSFEVAIADTNPLLLLVYERYASKEAYLEHRTSAAFLEYKAKQEELQWPPAVAGQSYIEADFGYI